MDTSTSLQTVGSFWKRPEGKVGKWFNFALLAAAGYFLYNYRTDLLSFVTDTIHLVIACSGLAVLLFLIMDSKFRNLLSYAYIVIMRKITGVFIEMDPVTAIKNKIQRMWCKREEMGKQLVQVKAGVEKLHNFIDANEQQRIKAIGIMKQAKLKNDSQGFEFASRSAGRYQDSNDHMQPQLQRLQKVYDVGLMMYQNAEYVIKDKEEDLNLKINEFEVMKSSTNLINAAKSIFDGNSAEDAIYNQAYDYMMNSIASSEAELDVFVDSSKNIMSQINLESGVMSDKGMQMLTDFENQQAGLTLLNGGKKLQTIPENASFGAKPITQANTFDNLLN